ncbi:MAG: hypothetical protein ABS87_07380 [Sphingomonas sp. SCN 67-18]|uniref:hypothetical protein n=1 Tax=uncultured Sphingomonas sp. TaxID=158754 RepID=UPI00086F2C39|nr:hypothetical protein [Sphingomonas sp. SCN 67-18]ODU21189.1 MAG: hypothetical protein ABS87_07380 [Sphingomonas sp. SCN 67-18]
MLKRSHLCVLAATVALAFSTGLTAQETKEDPGKALVDQRCTVCHEITTINSQHLSESGWKEIVDRMVLYGAQANDEEQASILHYLTTTYGAASVSSASPVHAAAKPQP